MNNNPLHTQEKIKCSAKTRRGTLCQTLPVTGRKRCRMHGGTNNGAPKGNQNALKHGRYTRAVLENRKKTTQLKRQFRELMREINQNEF